MTKILSIVPYKIFPAKVGGQKGIAIFNEYLGKETELICVTVKSNDPSYAKGYQLLNILSNSSFRYINPWYIWMIRALIRKYKPTHLLLEHPYYGWLGYLLKKLTGTKLIIHSHNIEALRWKGLGKWWWKILWYYEKFTHRTADFNFFIHDDDRSFAVTHFHLMGAKCITVSYGIGWEKPPSVQETEAAKKTIRARYAIDDEETVLFFNGAFNYQPNLEALKQIIYTIYPILKTNAEFHFKIIICGSDIPAAFSSLANKDIIFAGFVDDVSLYFKGADIFLNPITAGGGIKTKLVEALAYNLNAVSTVNGAIGVDPALCNGKLLVVPDNNWQLFTEAILRAAHIHADIPSSYFNHFYWGHSLRKAVEFVKEL